MSLTRRLEGVTLSPSLIERCSTVSNGKRSRSVERALLVLCALAESGGPIGISEISRRTGLSKSTIHLSLQTMAAMRFVEQDSGSERYVLGLAASQLGAAAVDQSRLVAALASPMRQLAERSQEAVSLGIQSQRDVLFVKRFETSHVLRTSIREGTRMPLHASASGKCLLLGMSIEEICDLYPHEELPEQASNTLASRAALIEELEQVRERGYAISHDEFLDGVSGAAVPVRIGGRVAASMSIAGPTARFCADDWIGDLLDIVRPLSGGDIPVLAASVTDVAAAGSG